MEVFSPSSPLPNHARRFLRTRAELGAAEDEAVFHISRLEPSWTVSCEPVDVQFTIVTEPLKICKPCGKCMLSKRMLSSIRPKAHTGNLRARHPQAAAVASLGYRFYLWLPREFVDKDSERTMVANSRR